jgi:starch synthase
MTKVLSVASEVYPLVKTGGLADVVGALPATLAAKGVEMRTLVPGYPKVMAAISNVETVLTVHTLGGEAKILSAKGGGLDLFVIDAPHLYMRDGGIYGDAAGNDWADNWMRFGALSQLAARIAEGDVPSFVPDIVHAHDWQAGLVPAYLKYGKAHATPSILTVHNLAFQGRYAADIFPALGLPTHAYGMDGIEYFGGVGYLKAGLQAAWAVTTVSPTYAREIRSSEFGMGLDGLLNARSSSVYGIVNGIDIDVWNPEKDKDIPKQFSAKSLSSRNLNRKALEKHFGLKSGSGPIFVVVSRLTWQKGLDLLSAAADTIVALGGSLAVLGSGDAAIEGQLHACAARHPGKVGVVIGYDEALSHLMQAGGDAILIPSRFEPCGLTQLYALRYGCVPVVARTGGLADTVIDANDAALSMKVATGLQFAPVDTASLNDVIARTCALFADKPTWTAMQVAGMSNDVSWDRSAGAYNNLYNSLLKSKV